MLRAVWWPMEENLEVTHRAGGFPGPGVTWELGNTGSCWYLCIWLEMTNSAKKSFICISLVQKQSLEGCKTHQDLPRLSPNGEKGTWQAREKVLISTASGWTSVSTRSHNPCCPEAPLLRLGINRYGHCVTRPPPHVSFRTYASLWMDLMGNGT